ncbi:hypothetical protein [Streptomyces uncialis]|uniref:Scaffolding protein n=1 Tax=Streptomyces uncialis TaxID=1048205 RepID=A0A1Q4VCD5_9ACTN|nr:hypothetical protein [Streptomyces uncialis]OKH95419.1 hypothetical protein AB852_00710 [Streptomyces uncialis]
MIETQSAENDTSEQEGPAIQSASGNDSDAEKWKALSRENEKRWKAASRELDQLRESQMSDQERAISEAREEARSSALTEFGTSLAEAEIRAQAATAGISVPTDYLDLGRFLSEDGRADRDKVTAFIASLPKPAAPEPEFPPLKGAGHYSSGGGDISTMDPTELADIIANGRFI